MQDPMNLMNLKKNDVVDKGNGKSMVLEVVGCIYILSGAYEFDVAEGFYTLADLERDGYRIVETPRGRFAPVRGERYWVPDCQYVSLESPSHS